MYAVSQFTWVQQQSMFGSVVKSFTVWFSLHFCVGLGLEPTSGVKDVAAGRALFDRYRRVDGSILAAAPQEDLAVPKAE